MKINNDDELRTDALVLKNFMNFIIIKSLNLNDWNKLINDYFVYK